tara:strand:+ start:331 stop:1806 length:1476 start_codon:yes stop_codon:yes gene_type:complete
MIQFGEWLPDQPALNNAGATQAKNVIPAMLGYRSFKSLSPLSGAATAKILGLFAGKDDDGNAALYAGDSGKLYKFNAADSTLADVSKSGGYTVASSDKWRFAQFGEMLIAVNGHTDSPQKITLAGGGLFSDLAGTPPKAKFITTVRDQVFMANTSDSSDGVKPYRLWFSGINSAESWTPGTSLSDYQDVVDVGHCTGVVGGEHLIALFERSIVRGTFVGGGLIYQFDKLTTDRGCSVPGSIASVGPSMVFFLSDDGFYQLRGNEIVPIGAQKINRWFLDRFDTANRDNVVSGVDPVNQNVIWAYPSLSASGGENNEILVYNYHLNKWSYAEQDCTAIAQLFTAGYTLEQLDNISSNIETLPASLDDGVYMGGTFFFAGAKDKKVQSFTGDTLAATVETGEFTPAAGRRTLVNNILPYVSTKAEQTPTISATIGSRSRQHDSETFGSASTVNADGYCPVRASGAYHRVRLSTTGDYDVLQGVDVDMQQVGLR